MSTVEGEYLTSLTQYRVVWSLRKWAGDIDRERLPPRKLPRSAFELYPEEAVYSRYLERIGGL